LFLKSHHDCGELIRFSGLVLILKSQNAVKESENSMKGRVKRKRKRERSEREREREREK